MSTDTLSESSAAPTEQADRFAIDAQAADRLFRAAHTTHAFSDEPVTDAQIQAAWDLVRWAPTAMNTLPLRLLVVRTPEAKQRLGAHMADFNRDKTLAAPVTIVAAADPSFHQHLGTLAPFREGIAEQLDPQADLREGMARTNALIQIGYLIVGLRAAGLSVGPMTGFDAAGIDAEFFGESGWRTLVAINVGYPADEGAHFPRQARLDFHQVAEVL